MKQSQLQLSYGSSSTGLLYAGAPGGERTVYGQVSKPVTGPTERAKPPSARCSIVTMPVLASKEVQAKSDAELKKVSYRVKGR